MTLQFLITQRIDAYGRAQFFNEIKLLAEKSNSSKKIIYERAYIYYSALFNIKIDIDQDMKNHRKYSEKMLKFFIKEAEKHQHSVIRELIEITKLKQQYTCYIKFHN